MKTRNSVAIKFTYLFLSILIFQSKAFAQVMKCKEIKDGISENYWSFEALGIRTTPTGTQGFGTVIQHTGLSQPRSWADKRFSWKFEKNGSSCQLNFELAMSVQEKLKFKIPLDAPIDSQKKFLVTTEMPVEKNEPVKFQCTFESMEDAQKFCVKDSSANAEQDSTNTQATEPARKAPSKKSSSVTR